MQQDTHLFQGMRRDSHPIRQEKQYLWDAHNIRLTTRDGNTMLSVTNEKSTRNIITFSEGETYIGHCVIGDYLILLTTGFKRNNENRDIIYRINLSSDYKTEILYEGTDLNFDADHPAQMISDYESELIQKIYWVDGLNSPRVINIAKPELVYPDKNGVADPVKTALYKEEGSYSSLYKDHPFDFIQTMELDEKVSVKRLSSSVGIFPSGVIQYAMTYLHKYGQESNIFYTSQLLYLSYDERGGSPEDRIGTSFEITVQNIDTKFQYIRLYSIIRTSIDAVPVVKRVMDIDITDVKEDSNGVTEVSFIDTNTTGDTVDPTYLLYVGGKDIVANCIASKDNTLFLGGISYKRRSVYSLDIVDESHKLYPSPNPTVAQRPVSISAQNTEYKYANQLSQNTSTFKNGETYRLGCRFQYKNGEWSEPVYVDDFTYEFKSLMEQGYNLGYDGSTLNLGKITGDIDSTLKQKLLDNGYKKVQALIVQPSYKDRSIIAQGILCPTVGNVGNRARGGGAQVQSSWLLRPWSSQSEGGAYSGSIPACENNYSLPFGKGANVEIQNMAIMLGGNQTKMSYYDMTDTSAGESFYNAFVVDQYILTMHSPDIEFGDIDNIINSDVNLSLYNVGTVRFDTNKGEIDVQTETPVIDPDASGFLKKSISGDGARSLISGLFYEDAMADDEAGGKSVNKHKSPKLWMTYMWHRTGSLNNDCVRPEGTGTRSSVLKKKSITNFKVSNSTVFKPIGSKLDTYDIKSFNSNEVSLVKLDAYEPWTDEIQSFNYYGNIDTVIPSYLQYSFVCSPSSASKLSNPDFQLSGQVYVRGEQKSFSNLSIKGAVSVGTTVMAGSSNGGSVLGALPYITDATTTITNSSSTSGGAEGDPSSDSNTTIASEGTKVVMVNLQNKASVSVDFNDGEFSGTVVLNEEVTADDDKTKVPKDFSWTINGKASYTPTFTKDKTEITLGEGGNIKVTLVTPPFNGATETVDSGTSPGNELVGDFIEALKLSKDSIRMKYKSTPHAVVSIKKPLDSELEKSGIQGSLILAELRQPVNKNLIYGGKTEEALRNNLWIPAGPALNISDAKIEWIWGDTWFQRYDCLKTYPFTFEDINQVTEIGSFYCETRVNIDGRYDRNRGSTSFNLSPVNFNLINPVYSQLDTFFTSRMFDDDYYKVTDYPSQFLWTGVKSSSSNTDTWTNLHTANSYDMDGSNGKLTAIQSFNDILIGFQDKAISQILFNSRVQVQASDGVPIEIANNQKIEGVRTYSNNIGCQDKFSVITTPMGIYFMDNNSHNLYKFDGQLNNIGLQLGNMYWARENYWDVTWRYPAQDDKYNGIRLSYDPKYQDIYFTPGADYSNREALCYSEQLGQFTSMMSYGGAVMFPHRAKFYSIAPDPDGIMTLWENFPSDSYSYNNIFGIIRDYGFSFISNDNPNITKIFDTVEMRADCYTPNDNRDDNFGLLGKDFTYTNQTGKPFNTIRVDNEYQDTGDVTLDDTNMRKKFRVWRALIPRKKDSRERIRNPWAKITLGMKNPDNKMTILHDLNVGYTV